MLFEGDNPDSNPGQESARGQLLRTGERLFTRHGTRRVTIEEICREAGVSKVTFYRHFRNKKDFARAVVQGIVDRAMIQYHRIMEDPVDFEQKIEAVIRMKLEVANSYGELFVDELTRSNPDLMAFILEKQKENESLTRDFLLEGQRAGVLSRQLPLEVMMSILGIWPEILNNPRLAKEIPDFRQRFNYMMRFFFYGLMEPDSGRSRGKNQD